MKRNRLARPATIGLIGLTAFTLAACQEEVMDVPVIRSSAECTALPGATPAECDAAMAQAQAEHQQTAPRYDAVEVCEATHGVGNCQADTSAQSGGGGGSIFMPILMGYLMGSMMGKMAGGAAAAPANARSMPLYPGAGGTMATADGSTRMSQNATGASVNSQAFKAQPSTLGKAPMSNSAVRSTGGFGSSGADRAPAGGAGGFGG